MKTFIIVRDGVAIAQRTVDDAHIAHTGELELFTEPLPLHDPKILRAEPLPLEINGSLARQAWRLVPVRRSLISRILGRIDREVHSP
jgi:hypothetical protein